LLTLYTTNVLLALKQASVQIEVGQA
jgi:hypothetical protein